MGSPRWLCSRLLQAARARLALALVLPAYLLHSLVDVDWDYVAVSGPAFLVAGALAGRAIASGAVSGFAVLAATGAALAAFGSLLLPWLGHRWSGEAQAALGNPKHAAVLARRARAVDPLLVDPFYTLALTEVSQGHPNRAYAFYEEATKRQPANPETWQSAGLLRVAAQMRAGRVRQPGALHRARPVRAGRRGRQRVQRRAEDRERRPGDLLSWS